MAEKVVGGLKWVKAEIAATLRRVRGLVEVYGRTSEPIALGDAVDALFEVRGVLLALQLILPARLVDEMQRLCDAMAERRVRSPKEAAEAMMLALIQLPSHLDRLDAGADLPPLSLWPTINDLRESRGAPPLTPAELLVPGSVLAAEDEELPAEALEALAVALRKVRPHFHRHLVDWYRSTTSAEGLIKLSRLFQQLHRFLKDGILADLFRLAEAYTAGLQRGQVAADADAQALVGRLDRVFKPLVTAPPAWPEAQIRDLIDAFLTELDQADVQPVLVAEIRAHGARPAVELPALEGAPEALAGLAEAMLGEMAILKECLDLYARGKRDDRTPLEALRVGMGNLARALEGADTGDLAPRLRALGDAFGDLAMAATVVDAVRLEPLRGELLGIEVVLQAYAQPGLRPWGLDQAPDHGDLDGAATPLRGVRTELVGIKAAVLDCQPQGARPASFRALPERLASVAEAFAQHGDAQASAAAEAIANLVEQRYLAVDRFPWAGEFDRLADAIAALDLYIERCEEGQPAATDLLARVAASLAELTRLLDQAREPAAPGSGIPVPVPADGGDPGQGPAGAGIAPEFLDIFLEEAREETHSIGEQFVRWGANPGDEVALTTLRRSFHTLKGSGRLVGAVRVADLAQVVENILNCLIEQSLISDAGLRAYLSEVIELLPDLVNAEAQNRPLDVRDLLRRAAAWGTPARSAPASPAPIPALSTPSPAPAAAVSETPAARQGLLIESADLWFESQPRPEPPAGGPGIAPPRAEVAAYPGAAVADDHDRVSRFAADAELLDLFRGETAQYLDDLRAFLARAAAGQAVPDEATVRALHTLNGSAAMAGIDSIAAVATMLERRLRPLQSAAGPVPAPLLALLERSLDAIAARAAEVPATDAGAAALADLRADLAALPTPGPAAPVDLPDSGFLEWSAPALADGAAGCDADVTDGGIDLVLRDSDLADFFGQLPEPELEWEPGPDSEPDSNPDSEPDSDADLDSADGVGVAAEAVTDPFATGPAALREEGLPDLLPVPAPASTPAPTPEDARVDADALGAELAQALHLLDVELGGDAADWPGPAGGDASVPVASAAPAWSRRDAAVPAVDALDWELVPLALPQWPGAQAAGECATPPAAGWSAAPVQGGHEPAAEPLGSPESFALIESVDEMAPLPELWPAPAGVPQGTGPVAQTQSGDALEPFAVRSAQPTLEAPNVSTVAATAPPAAAPVPVATGGHESGAAAAPVPPQHLAQLIAAAAEIGRDRAQLAQRNGLVGAGLAQLDEIVRCLHEELRRLGTQTDSAAPDQEAPLPPHPGGLLGNLNELAHVRALLDGHQRQSADLLAQQAQAAAALQDGLLRLHPASLPAFLVSVADQVYALPHTAVAGVARVPREDLDAIDNGQGRDFADRGEHYRLAGLARLLDPAARPDLAQRRWLPLLLTRVGDLRVALQVDHLIGCVRLAVMPLGPQLAAVRWLAGGAILPDGRVALVLDALALLGSSADRDGPAGAQEEPGRDTPAYTR